MKGKISDKLLKEIAYSKDSRVEALFLDEETFKGLENPNYGLKEPEEQAQEGLKEIYRNIIDILKEYCDLKEEYYNIVALWIIGTYYHEQFPTYPYLFLNAMRGSGKSRTLKLITYLSKEGSMLNSLTEAVLFRSTGCLGIDEFEGLERKGKEALRELLNSAYKKGTKVRRMKKQKTLQGEEQVIEEFEIYRPVVMANIWGMENVLADRCVTLILEKSNKKEIINLMEIWESENIVQKTKKLLSNITKKGVVSVGVVTVENLYKMWNNYVKYGTTNYTNYTNNTHYTNYTYYTQVFEKVKFAGINGRELELSFPLFFLASQIGGLDETISTITTLMKEKREEDATENRDISLYDFISQEPETSNYVTIKELLKKFRDYLQSDEDWINSKWLGNALKRLKLVVNKRRQNRGVEVTLDYKKAQEKIKMFR